MNEDQRKELIERIIYYANTVNGFPCRKKNILYWESLPDDILFRVYRKWRDLYGTGIFLRDDD